jgi:large subunit ribosomal protein L32
MAVPKRRKSKSKRDKGRTHKRLTAPGLSTCPECGEAKLPHQACPNCGSYKGRKVIESEE